MALGDWNSYGSPEIVELTADYVAEGSKALKLYGNPVYLIHKQTEADKPQSGALKTYFLLKPNENPAIGAVFKFTDADTNLCILTDDTGYYEVDWGYSKVADGYFDITLEHGVWYILVVIVDSDNDTVTLRIADKDENVLAETAISGMPSDCLTATGGIGLFNDNGVAYFDLTKIYYP